MFTKTVTYNREDRDYAAHLDGNCIGFYRSQFDAERALDAQAYEQASRQPAAPAPLTITPIESEGDILAEIDTRNRLEQTEASITEAIDRNPISANAKALRAYRLRVQRAKLHLALNGLPTRVRGGWLVVSGRSTYRVSEDGCCDCEAGRNGRECKHAELVGHMQPIAARKAA